MTIDAAAANHLKNVSPRETIVHDFACSANNSFHIHKLEDFEFQIRYM